MFKENQLVRIKTIEAESGVGDGIVKNSRELLVGKPAKIFHIDPRINEECKDLFYIKLLVDHDSSIEQINGWLKTKYNGETMITLYEYELEAI